MSFDNIPAWEKPVVERLIHHCLKGDRSISVNDSEEWTLRESRDVGSIKSALFTADDDYIRVHDREGETLGHFWLIYNNGSEQEPMVLISDYTANAFCEATVNLIEQDMAKMVSVPNDELARLQSNARIRESQVAIAIAALANIRITSDDSHEIAGKAIDELVTLAEGLELDG